ncbi:hypothetical protein AMTR_s00530p00013930 [Amborella trichopoda]|uniref:Uncharacterized protein n=1 Tax=Amborella trichopoda TaxID=13333 RepID=W1P3V2_AMBTC|nr:hypothetical protein AMTR_s00530p00013930 [Amborella trichopoda]
MALSPVTNSQKRGTWQKLNSGKRKKEQRLQASFVPWGPWVSLTGEVLANKPEVAKGLLQAMINNNVRRQTNKNDTPRDGLREKGGLRDGVLGVLERESRTDCIGERRLGLACQKPTSKDDRKEFSRRDQMPIRFFARISY